LRNLSQKRKVLFISSGGGYGGGDKFLYDLLKSLDRKNFEPIVAFYFQNSGPDTERISDLGVPLFFLGAKTRPAEYVPFRWLLRDSKSRLLHGIRVVIRLLLDLLIVETPLILRLLRLIKRENISLAVLNNDVTCHIAGALSARIAGIRCVCRKAGQIGGSKKMKRLLSYFVNAFIAVSEATEQDQRINNPFKRKLLKIYEGVDLKVFDPEKYRSDISNLRGQLGIPIHTKVVGNICRFEKGKGQEEFLEAASVVIESYPGVVFLIVGDGELKQGLRERVKNLNLNDFVLFTGWRTDIPEILSITDIFVHCPTTLIEALGIANLEAMAMGKAVIVSQNGGLTDAVIDGTTGFVVPRGNTERLAEAILRLLRDGKLIAQLGNNARRRIEEEFDIEKNAKKIEAVFEEILR